MTTEPAHSQPIDFVIITVLEVELQALLQILPSPTKQVSNDGSIGVFYNSNVPVALPDGTVLMRRVVIMQARIGRVNAAIAANNAIRQWQPRYILLIGIAGGVAQTGIRLGDVLISDQIIDYELQKLTDVGAQPRFEVYRPDSSLLEVARHVARGQWTKFIQTKRPSQGKVTSHFGPIASGDKVIASRDELAKLQEHWPRLIGVEMEGAGIAAAVVSASSAPSFLIIRAVADLIDGSKQPDVRKWQAYAAAVAAAFTVGLLNDVGISTISSTISVQPPQFESSKDTSAATNQITEVGEDISTSDEPADSISQLSASLQVRPKLTGYNTDSPAGVDLLGIQTDVDAFASLIAARTTPPPLSIGIFGEWGSGKTFFMQRVKQGVAQIASEARMSGRLQKDIAYYKRIVQIEFNAWHYIEGNLWASLVEHILCNLRVTDSPDEIQVLQTKILSELGVQSLAETEIETQLQQVQDKLANIENTIADRTQELNQIAEKVQTLTITNIFATVMALPETQHDVNKLNELRQDLGLPTVRAGIDDISTAIAEAQAVVSRGAALFMPFVSAPDWMRRLLWLGILLLVGPMLGLIVGWLVAERGSQWVTQIAAILTTLTTWLYVIIGALRSATQWVSKRVAQIEQFKQHLDARIAKEQMKVRDQIAELEKQREQLKTEYMEAQRALMEAQARKKLLEDDLKHATPVHLLAKFIQDRVESNDYRKYLGVLALIRQDFEQMSRFIEAENRRLTTFQTIDEEEDSNEVRINRIVLYIDDLDRCPTDKVIQVLQAVHLLLAFPLFVVVIAVDARWISGALHEQYGELFSGGDDREPQNDSSVDERIVATPLDYLEKIFQIPFWLSPMDLAARRQMIEGLLTTNLIQDGNEPSDQKSASQDTTSNSANITIEEDAKQADALGKVESIIAANVLTTDLNPDTLTIQPAELAFMNELSPLLGRSPRALKRFINIYRLIKAGISDADQARFDPSTGEKAEFKIAMFLLAIVTNTPDFSQTFFSSLYQLVHESKTKKTLRSSDWESLLNHSENLKYPETGYIKVFLQSDTAASIRAINVQRLLWWMRRVSRFSFFYGTQIFE